MRKKGRSGKYSLFATFLLAALIVAGMSILLHGGPTVIQDNRVTNVANTPVLGRGYTISTNTFQSTCLTDVVMTEPSYDFTYTFTSIEQSGKEGLGDIIDLNLIPEKYRTALVKKLFDKTKMLENDRYYYEHRILVVINLHSYYASVDESKAKISESAGLLLKNNDIPGFFSSCGSYYVRSIGRTAKFISVFSYRTSTDKPDQEFEKEIETQIKSFGQNLNEKKDEKTATATTTTTTATATLSNTFARASASRRLMIDTSAFGLGKNQNASIISYDIDTFKSAIKDAFLAMQNPDTGKVTSIEIVPWVENTDFQALIKLEQKTEVEDKKTGTTRTLFLYEKKQILSANAEFLAELERLDRAFLNLYYKGRMCRKQIEENWTDRGFLKAEFAEKTVINNKGGKKIVLRELMEALSDERLERIINDQKKYMYGSSGRGDKDGALACMKKIMQQGIYKTNYREIDECRDILSKTVYTDYEAIDSYCMPVLE